MICQKKFCMDFIPKKTNVNSEITEKFKRLNLINLKTIKIQRFQPFPKPLQSTDKKNLKCIHEKNH